MSGTQLVFDLQFEDNSPQHAGRLAMSEHIHDPATRARVRDIEDRLGAGPFVTSAEERERLIAERRQLVIDSMTTEEREVFERHGLIASEAPAAGPPQTRRSEPASGPACLSEQQMDEQFCALVGEGDPRAQAIRAEQQHQRLGLAEGGPGRRSARELGDLQLAAGMGLALTAEERRAVELADEQDAQQAAREADRLELRGLSERLDADRARIERDTLNAVIGARRRQGRSLVGAIAEADRITGRKANPSR